MSATSMGQFAPIHPRTSNCDTRRMTSQPCNSGMTLTWPTMGCRLRGKPAGQTPLDQFLPRPQRFQPVTTGTNDPDRLNAVARLAPLAIMHKPIDLNDLYLKLGSSAS